MTRCARRQIKERSRCFVKVNAPTTTLQPGSTRNWSFSCELKRTDTQ